MSETQSEVASPCIKWCIVDRQRRLCTGCYRTLDEIGGWILMSQSQRAQVVAACHERRAQSDWAQVSN
jgi:predicted Fe-S protein YdhL (DUF1289 family)